MNSNRLTLTVWALCSLLVLPGCGDSGPKLVPIAGRIVIDGEPLDHGYVRFVPKHGRSSDAEVKPDGTFALKYSTNREGAVLGIHRVEVAANEVLSPSKVKWHAPKHYASMASSGLEFEVVGPRQDLTIELSWGDASGPYVETFSETGEL